MSGRHHDRASNKRRFTGSVTTAGTPSSTPSASIAASIASGKKSKKSGSKEQSLTAQKDDDSASSACMGNLPFQTTDTPPKELFVGSTPDTKIRGTEITVSALVGVRLFPQIKFVCNPTVELMFCRDARSICGVVMSECSPPVNITEQDWWEHARKWISKQVSVLRNSKNTQMKWSFMGKH
jgi:hypothetical protein